MELLAEIKAPEFKKAVEGFVRRMNDAFALGLADWKVEENAQTLAKQLSVTTVDKTQVRLILEIAQSTGSVSDILDAIKIRVGRDTQRKGWDHEGVGRKLLETLGAIRARVDQFLKDYPKLLNENSDIARVIHLQLCRLFLKHLSAHFEYVKKEKEDRNG